ncbi:PREDICTED: agamous-like MADS-box protein AGL61 [Fragaria vesca subsp. vesca]|uniref:agamous-like MADS-box protein AGL61 n=1 Tax=Fragaria vesca subsp. vesca TaxID=101020 RepID=UPI0002C32609|nr:PREDICTED: agamous-like MADS-box protein AGL61 [Fragaria vesca subsp. vesca]
MTMKKSNRSSQGRQKIPIAKIAKRTNLQVTFSKRRSGLFKKASELCTLCGVEVAIIVFSPANKPYSFCHPDVDSLIDRFLARNPNFNMSLSDSCQQLGEAHKNATAHELNMQLTRISNQVETERKLGESLDKMSKTSECWWENPVDELGLDELRILQAALEELKKNLNEQTNRIWMESSNTTNIANNSSSFFMTNNGHHLSKNSSPRSDQVGSDYIDIPRAYDFGFAGNIGLF